MSKRKLHLVAVAGLALLAVTCEEVPLTAPAGTTLFLQANPPFVAANGGTSVVTALLTEPAGTLVPDGTVVMFFTNLGRVDEEGKTRNGVARVNFVSDSRSGTATVTAYSGGPAPAPSASPTAGTDAGFTASGHVGASASGDVATAATSTGTGSASITIDIGSKLPARVLVTADPAVLAGSRSAAITANVFDEFGNPVQHVPVIFQVSEGVTPSPSPFAASALQEFLASGGAPQYTDSNGQAFDTLTTRAPNGTLQKTVTVTATTANDKKGTVTVAVNYSVPR
jgi:hypothetical protein